MKKQSVSKSNAKKLEGEGSYTAARAYDKNVRSFAAQGNTERLAEEARRAVEGKDGGELRRAEQRAKAGPKSSPKRSG